MSISRSLSIFPVISRVLLFSAMAGLLPSVVPAAVSSTLSLPPRSSSALTGSQFYTLVQNKTIAEREALVYQEIAAGNVPDFLRTLKPISVTATINSQQRTAVYYVTPDYVAIGSDADFFRMPVSAPLAQRIANLGVCNLPTRKMVNDIYTNSTVRLAPYPFSPDSYNIMSVVIFYEHQKKIEEQRAGKVLGELVGGIKKDIVVTPQLLQRPPPPRVAIYGWHQLNGSPIQPLSLIHEETYMDYSHGVRLVNQAMLVDGAETTVAAVLADATLAVLLSDEGAFTNTSYPVPESGLVVNGGFEDTFTGGVGNGWTAWQASGSNAITYGRASVNKYEGSYSQYYARGDTLPFDGGVYQRITVVPGAVYRVRAWMKRQSVLTGTLMAFGYDPTGGTDGTAASVVYGDLMGGTDNTWVGYEATFAATGMAVTLFARGGHTGTTGGTNSYFYLDAVSMTQEGAATPTPTSTPNPSPSPVPTPVTTSKFWVLF